MKGRVLLVNPWIYDFAAYDLWLQPLGLLYIAAVLRDAGYEVAYLDCLDRHHPALLARLGDAVPKSTPYGTGKFYKTILDKPPLLRDVPRRYGRYGLPLDIFDDDLARLERPDVVLVTSGMTYWYPGPFEAIRRIKSHFTGVPVILGGIYATLCHAHAVAYSGADVVVAGEGELAALQWANRLTGHEDDPLPMYATLDDLPYPAHDLRRRQDAVVINTSRGCPMRCTYCASSLLHPAGFRQRDPLAVVAEIRWWHTQYGTGDIVFYDDALLVRASAHMHVILDEIIRQGLRCRFHTPNGMHARLIDEALATKMYAAGFRTIRMSLETVNPARRHETGPKVSQEDVRRAIGYLQQAGFSGRDIGVYILMGLPDQPLQEVLDSIEFVHACGALVYLTLYSPIPGTVEWQKAVREGRIAADADPLLHNNTIYPMLRGDYSEEACQHVKDVALAGNRRIV